VRGRDALAHEYAQSERASAGFFEGFNFAQPNQSGELISVARNRIGSRSPSFHRARDYVDRDFFEPGSELDSLLGFDWHEFSWRASRAPKLRSEVEQLEP